MESIDLKKAAAVWQRVQGHTQPVQPDIDPQSLLPIIAEEWIDATTYLSLSRRLRGKESALLRKMAEQEQSHAACLKGLYVLLSGEHPHFRTPPASAEPVEQLLRRCYGREMHCLAQYENRSDDPRYGPVFVKLAQQEREHCRHILALLGSLPHR